MKKPASRCRLPCAGLLAAALACACASSPPLRFYTLSSVDPESRPQVSPNTIPVRITRVTLPGELDRSQLVRRIDPTRLQIDDEDRWAAPLDDVIRRVLSADLAARVSSNLVLDSNEPAEGQRMQGLALDVHDFYADAGCTVTLQATWILTPPQLGKDEGGQANPPRQAREQIQVPATGACSGVDSVPGAMSRALALLSDRIAAAVAASPAAAR